MLRNLLQITRAFSALWVLDKLRVVTFNLQMWICISQVGCVFVLLTHSFLPLIASERSKRAT